MQHFPDRRTSQPCGHDVAWPVVRIKQARDFINAPIYADLSRYSRFEYSNIRGNFIANTRARLGGLLGVAQMFDQLLTAERNDYTEDYDTDFR